MSDVNNVRWQVACFFALATPFDSHEQKCGLKKSPKEAYSCTEKLCNPFWLSISATTSFQRSAWVQFRAECWEANADSFRVEPSRGSWLVAARTVACGLVYGRRCVSNVKTCMLWICHNILCVQVFFCLCFLIWGFPQPRCAFYEHFRICILFNQSYGVYYVFFPCLWWILLLR